MGQIPVNLENKQVQKKKETLEKIQAAIDVLYELGYKDIKINSLIGETGLARSTFYKPYVQELLKKNAIGRFKGINKDAHSNSNQSEEITKLEKKLIIANEKIERYKIKLKDTENKLKLSKLELLESKIELQRTVGKFQALYEKVISMGIKITLLPKEKNES